MKPLAFTPVPITKDALPPKDHPIVLWDGGAWVPTQWLSRFEQWDIEGVFSLKPDDFLPLNYTHWLLSIPSPSELDALLEEARRQEREKIASNMRGDFNENLAALKPGFFGKEAAAMYKVLTNVADKIERGDYS